MFKKFFKKIQSRKKVVFSYLLILIVYIVIFAFFRKFEISREKVESIVNPLGNWGFIALFLLQFVASLTPIPDSVLLILGALLFGPIQGGIVIISAMTFASLVHYWVALRVGEKEIIKRFPLIKEFTKDFQIRASIKFLIIFRLLSFISFDTTAYLAGISKVGFKSYLIATIIALTITFTLTSLLAQGLLLDFAILKQ